METDAFSISFTNTLILFIILFYFICVCPSQVYTVHKRNDIYYIIYVIDNEYMMKRFSFSTNLTISFVFVVHNLVVVGFFVKKILNKIMNRISLENGKWNWRNNFIIRKWMKCADSCPMFHIYLLKYNELGYLSYHCNGWYWFEHAKRCMHAAYTPRKCTYLEQTNSMH